MKPITKGKLLSDLHANCTVYRLSSYYLFNVVAKQGSANQQRQALRVANIFQKRAIVFYQRASKLEELMKNTEASTLVDANFK